MRTLGPIVLGIALALAPGVPSVEAQTPPAARPAPGSHVPGDTLARWPGREHPGMERRLEEFRRRRIEQALGIDSVGADLVEGELRRFRDRQLELRLERGRLLAELERVLQAGEADEAALRARLDELHRNQDERERALSDLRERLSHDLSLEQQARLQLFAERFQRRLADGLQRIEERRRRFGPGPFRGEGDLPPTPPSARDSQP